MVTVNINKDFEPKLAYILNWFDNRITAIEERQHRTKENFDKLLIYTEKKLKESGIKMVDTSQYKSSGNFLTTQMVEGDKIEVRISPDKKAEFKENEYQGKKRNQLYIYVDLGENTDGYTLRVNKQNNEQLGEDLESYDTDKWAGKWLRLTKVRMRVANKDHIVWDMSSKDSKRIVEVPVEQTTATIKGLKNEQK